MQMLVRSAGCVYTPLYLSEDYYKMYTLRLRTLLVSLSSLVCSHYGKVIFNC